MNSGICAPPIWLVICKRGALRICALLGHHRSSLANQRADDINLLVDFRRIPSQTFPRLNLRSVVCNEAVRLSVTAYLRLVEFKDPIFGYGKQY
jgi:hypothetical protein